MMLLLLLAAAAAEAPDLLAAASAEAPDFSWSNLGNDPGHSGRGLFSGPSIDALADGYVSLDSATSLQDSLLASLVVDSEGSLYSLSASTVYKLDPSSLLPLWSTALPLLPGTSTPVLGSHVYVTTSSCTVMALDRGSGAEVWHAGWLSRYTGACSQLVAYPGALALVVGGGSTLLALDAHTGALLWRLATSSTSFSTLAPLAVSTALGTVYTGAQGPLDSSASACSVDAASGALLWCTPLPNATALTTPVALGPSSNSSSSSTPLKATTAQGPAALFRDAHALYALGAEGALLWAVQLPPACSAASPALSPDSATAYLSTTTGLLHALSTSTGAPAWQQRYAAAPVAPHPPLLPSLLAVGSTGTVYLAYATLLPPATPRRPAAALLLSLAALNATASVALRHTGHLFPPGSSPPPPGQPPFPCALSPSGSPSGSLAVAFGGALVWYAALPAAAAPQQEGSSEPPAWLTPTALTLSALCTVVSYQRLLPPILLQQRAYIFLLPLFAGFYTLLLTVLLSPPAAALWALLLAPPLLAAHLLYAQWARGRMAAEVGGAGAPGQQALAAADGDAARAWAGGCCCATSLAGALNTGNLLLLALLAVSAHALAALAAAVQNMELARRAADPCSSSSSSSSKDALLHALLRLLPPQRALPLMLLYALAVGCVEEGAKALVVFSPLCLWALRPQRPAGAARVRGCCCCCCARWQWCLNLVSTEAAAGAPRPMAWPATAAYNTVVRCMLAGIGFATLENFQYAGADSASASSTGSSSSSSTVPGCGGESSAPSSSSSSLSSFLDSPLASSLLIALVRALVSMPVHAICAGFTGVRAAVRQAQVAEAEAEAEAEAGAAGAAQRQPAAAPRRGSVWGWGTVLWPAALIHASFDFSLFVGGATGQEGLAAAAAAVCALAAAWALRSQLSSALPALGRGDVGEAEGVTCAPLWLPQSVAVAWEAVRGGGRSRVAYTQVVVEEEGRV